MIPICLAIFVVIATILSDLVWPALHRHVQVTGRIKQVTIGSFFLFGPILAWNFVQALQIVNAALLVVSMLAYDCEAWDGINVTSSPQKSLFLDPHKICTSWASSGECLSLVMNCDLESDHNDDYMILLIMI